MKTAPALLAAALFLAAPARASEGLVPPAQDWPHKTVTGTYDKAALQRGFQVYKQVCAACHSLKYVYYRNLEQLGYTPEQAKAVAAEYTVTDGPGDDGAMFERPARPSDHFKPPFANEQAARAANGGALPPDLSLVVKSRPHGEDYIYALLTGYGQPPADVTVAPGMHWNAWFPGHQVAMPPPLADGIVAYEGGIPATPQQMARDVTQFLAWAGDPTQDQRKQTGLKVLLYLLAFAAVAYMVKRKVWKDVH